MRNVLIIGVNDLSLRIYRTIRSKRNFGYRVVGFLGEANLELEDGIVLGAISKIEEILDQGKVHDVILPLSGISSDEVNRIIDACDHHKININILHENFDFLLGNYDSAKILNYPISSIRKDKINELPWRIAKRLFDIAFSLTLFIFVFSWLFPVLALIIKFNSKGKIFFKQVRIGKNNKDFLIYKFRTMYSHNTDIDSEDKFKQAKKDDPRTTSVGKWLRKTSIDELPQFINVLWGDMSIVGPRPHPIPLNKTYMKRIDKYNLRHLIKPGLTGWAQIKGFRGPTHDSELMKKRIEHDIWYLENWSYSLDIQIVILSIWLMLTGDKNAF